jgi:glycosyltransferase involved in cell wall biosynthesis
VASHVEPFRVGIDARLVARGLGVATYVRELVRDLVELDQVASVVWLGSPESAPRHPKVEPVATRRISRGGLHGRVDVMHFAANTGWVRPGPVPAVVTVHDLIFMGNRGRTLRQQLGRRYMQLVVPRAASAASRVIAVSAETASDVVAAGWSPAPVVIPHGIRELAGQPGPSENYFVVFGGADPRKNVSLALDAFEEAVRAAPDPPRLVVLAGAGLGSEDAGRARRMDRVELRPYLAPEAVRELLHRARALIHPTTSEGFGLPVLEGFAAGTAVVGGLTPVGRRIGGEALVRIDPADPVSSLAAHLTRLSSDPAAARAAALAGLARARDFSWRACAERHAEVYAAALGRPGA